MTVPSNHLLQRTAKRPLSAKVEQHLRALLVALVFVAASAQASATSKKEVEVVVLPAGYWSRADRIWQDPLKVALLALRRRCAPDVDDLIAVVETAVPEGHPDTSSTSAAADFLVSAGVRMHAIYEGQTPIAHLQTRVEDQAGTPGLRVGMVRVELVCTSAN